MQGLQGQQVRAWEKCRGKFKTMHIEFSVAIPLWWYLFFLWQLTFDRINGCQVSFSGDQHGLATITASRVIWMWKALRKEFWDRNPLWSQTARTSALQALSKSADFQRDTEHCAKWAYMSSLEGLLQFWQCPSHSCHCSDAPVTDIRASCEKITALKFWRSAFLQMISV